MRVTIFSNLNTSSTISHTGGKVVLYQSYLSQESENAWQNFIQTCAEKLWRTRPMCIRVFNSIGGELQSIDEILPNEVLFISRGEEFIGNNQGLCLIVSDCDI
jgi:hypothetical protein